MTNFRINVVSDTVCPWCYVGRRQLLLAQQMWHKKHPNSADTFTITYSPYQLEPQWPRGPAGSIDKATFYHKKFGPERTPLMHDRVSAAGEQLGITFKFGGRTGNTRDSHRLVRLAKALGNEAELRTVDGLFAAYFEKEQDITDYEVLRGVARSAGIPEDRFQKAIVESDECGREVDEDVGRTREDGVYSVPDYTIQGLFHMRGARDPSDFVSVFERVKAFEQQQQQKQEKQGN